MALVRLNTGNADWKGDANGTANVAPYDAVGNRLAKREGALFLPTSEAMPVAGVSNGVTRPLLVGKRGDTMVGFSNLEFFDAIEGATQNALLWANSVITMTIAQSNGELILNSASSLLVNTGAMITSNPQFLLNGNRSLDFRPRMRWIASPNSILEFGFGSPTTSTNPSIVNGGVLRLNAAGDIVAALTYNGVDSADLPIKTATEIGDESFQNNYYTFDCIKEGNYVRFIAERNDGSAFIDTKIYFGAAIQNFSSTTHLPIFVRCYNTASAPSAAPQIRISSVSVVTQDLALNMPFTTQLALSQRATYYNPLTYAQTANFTNNIAPTLRTPTNTTAAGETTFGGQMLWNNAGTSFAGSDTVDLILYAFTVPVGQRLILTDIIIETVNAGAVNGATAYTIQYFLAFNQTAVSLVTARALRIIGVQSIPAAAPIGTVFSSRLADLYTPPMVAESGRFVILGARILSGTATASQSIRTIWTPNGVFY